MGATWAELCYIIMTTSTILVNTMHIKEIWLLKADIGGWGPGGPGGQGGMLKGPRGNSADSLIYQTTQLVFNIQQRLSHVYAANGQRMHMRATGMLNIYQTRA